MRDSGLMPTLMPVKPLTFAAYVLVAPLTLVTFRRTACMPVISRIAIDGT